MRVAVALVSVGMAAFAQAPAKLTFEVASVKPSSGLGLSPRRTGEQVTWRGATMGFLVQYAYDVPYYQIAGALPPQPGQAYDIEAKVPLSATEAEVRRMFQALLEDRFALKIRRETKEMSVLELIADSKGHRMKAAQENTQIAVDGKPIRDGVSGVILGRDGRHVAGKAATMAQLVSALTTAVGKPVVDRTGLTGLFDFDVIYAPEDASFDTAPPIRPALQETLGLRLRGANARVPMIVIESIGPLSEN